MHKKSYLKGSKDREAFMVHFLSSQVFHQPSKPSQAAGVPLGLPVPIKGWPGRRAAGRMAWMAAPTGFTHHTLTFRAVARCWLSAACHFGGPPMGRTRTPGQIQLFLTVKREENGHASGKYVQHKNKLRRLFLKEKNTRCHDSLAKKFFQLGKNTAHTFQRAKLKHNVTAPFRAFHLPTD